MGIRWSGAKIHLTPVWGQWIGSGRWERAGNRNETFRWVWRDLYREGQSVHGKGTLKSVANTCFYHWENISVLSDTRSRRKLGKIIDHYYYLSTSAWLCQQSSWYGSFFRSSSSVRPSFVSRLSLNLLHVFVSNFICGFFWTVGTTNFFIWDKHFFFIFGTSEPRESQYDHLKTQVRTTFIMVLSSMRNARGGHERPEMG